MKKIVGSLIAFICLITSCSDGRKNEIQFYPFQEDEDGRWGMISPDGEILFSEEFKNEPTFAVNDLFLVKNHKNLWEYYTTEKTPQQIGEEYLEAGLFVENIAPVVRKNQPIEFINKKGETAFVLDKVEGHPVTRCSNFNDGIATFEANGYWGGINTDGEVVIPAQYLEQVIFSDGVAVVMHKKYEKTEEKDRKYEVIDKEGKVCFEFESDQYSNEYGYFFHDDVMWVKIGHEEDAQGALIDKKGNCILGPSSKLQQAAKNGQLVVFYDGEDWGLMNMDMEVIIRPKFRWLNWVSDDLIGAEIQDEDDYHSTYILYDTEGNPISDVEYETILPFKSGCDWTLAKEHNDFYVLINKEGETKSLDILIDKIGGANYDWTLTSDYIDLEALLSHFKVTKDSICGIAWNTLPREAVAQINSVAVQPEELAADTIVADTAEIKVEPEAEQYATSEKITDHRQCMNQSYSVTIHYGQNITQPVMKTIVEQGWYNSYIVERTVGHRFLDLTPQFIEIRLPALGKMTDKQKDVFKAAVKKYAPLGKLVDEKEDCKIYDLGNNKYLQISYDFDGAYIRLGNEALR